VKKVVLKTSDATGIRFHKDLIKKILPGWRNRIGTLFSIAHGLNLAHGLNRGLRKNKNPAVFVQGS